MERATTHGVGLARVAASEGRKTRCTAPGRVSLRLRSVSPSSFGRFRRVPLPLGVTVHSKSICALFSLLGIFCDPVADRRCPSPLQARLGLIGGRRKLGRGWGEIPRSTSMAPSVDNRAVLHIPTTTHAPAPTTLISNFATGSHTLPYHEHSISIPTSIPAPSHHGGPGHVSPVHLRRASPSHRSSLLSTLRDAYSPYPQWSSLWRLAV